MAKSDSRYVAAELPEFKVSMLGYLHSAFSCFFLKADTLRCKFRVKPNVSRQSCCAKYCSTLTCAVDSGLCVRNQSALHDRPTY